LTNKSYIGIREIYKKDRNRTEAVKAVWEGIVAKKIFMEAGELLKSNRLRFHSKKSTQFNYVLSGLIRCEKYGERLHGLVFNWLKDISANGEKFHRLQEEGRLRIKKRISFLNKSLKKLDTEEIELDRDIEKRVSELVKTKITVIKKTIKKSIVKLNDDKRNLRLRGSILSMK